jgi:hypothetical protein
MILFSIIDKKINATICRLATQNRVIKRRDMACISKLGAILKNHNLIVYERFNT